MGTMLRNGWTTLLGFILAVIYYLQQNGAKMPETRAEWVTLLIGALLAGLGVVAKDATTGSKPADRPL